MNPRMRDSSLILGKAVSMRKNKLTVLLFIGPGLAVLFAVSIFPLVYSLNLSLHRWNIIRPYYGYAFVGFKNFVNLFLDYRFIESLKITLYFTGGAVAIEFIFGLGLALLLSSEEIRKKEIIRIIRSVILIPMMVTPVVVGLIWRYILNEHMGVANYFLSLVGMEGLKWYSSPTSALPTVVLVDVWQWTPFVVIVLLAGIASLPTTLYEVSEIDGASAWQQFVYLTLPLLKPIIIIVLLFRIIDCVRIFDKVYVLTKGGPGTATNVISIYAYRTGIKYGNISYAAALSWILLFVILGLCFLLIKIGRWEI